MLPRLEWKERTVLRKNGKWSLSAQNFVLGWRLSALLRVPVLTESAELQKAGKEQEPHWAPGLNAAQNNFEALQKPLVRQREPARTVRVGLPKVERAQQREPVRMAQIVRVQVRQMGPGLKPADD